MGCDCLPLTLSQWKGDAEDLKDECLLHMMDFKMLFKVQIRNSLPGHQLSRGNVSCVLSEAAADDSLNTVL